MSESSITEQLGKMDWNVERWLLETVFRAQGFLREDSSDLNADQIEALLADESEETRMREDFEEACTALVEANALDEHGWKSLFEKETQERNKRNEEAAAEHEGLKKLRMTALGEVKKLFRIAQAQRPSTPDGIDPVLSPLKLASDQLTGVLRSDGDFHPWPVSTTLESFKNIKMYDLENAVEWSDKGLVKATKRRKDRVEAFRAFREFLSQSNADADDVDRWDLV
jgi:hypothetical protein